MDGSEGENNVKMIENTYDELHKDGFTLCRIIVTHPDKDHYRGIDSVLKFTGVNTPPVLLTDQFKHKLEKKKKVKTKQESRLKKFHDTVTELYSELPVGDIEYIENRALSTPFKVAYKSSTSDLVLYKTDNEMVEGPNGQRQTGEFRKPEKDRYNESSIVTTITSKDSKKIIACLTGDAFFDSPHQIATFLQDREIIVFQVPHHGSKHNSNFEFYRQIAHNIQYYLISCGHHRGYGFPDKEVFTAIRDATVAKKKEGATIVLVDGTHLNGKKVSSFTGGDYEPSISYWDPHLKCSDCEVINKDFLQFTFSGEGNLDPLQNLIQWSIKGYRIMTYSYGSKQRVSEMHLKTSNNRHLKVENGDLITEECQGNGCTTSIDGHIGLPAPTDPCTWDDSVIMVYGTSDLIFLQVASGEKIIKKITHAGAQADFKEKYISTLKLALRRYSRI